MSQIIDEIEARLEQFPQIKAVSFDVFDTLLFRTAVIPNRVFWFMYRKRPKLFPAFTSVGDWVSSRRTAEQEARRISQEMYGHTEVTLEEIYRCLPTVYSNYRELMQLEIDCECEVGFLNAEIADMIKNLHDDCNKRIFLISDMYLSSEQIGNILHTNGLDLSLIEKIYVSSEAKCSKKNGGLFRTALKEQDLVPGELLHIGDNLQGDIGSARHLGIYACYYNFMTEREFRYPFLLWERELFSSPLCEELYLARLLADQNKRKNDKKDPFFYTLGAMIIGPFLTCAVEWVIDEALSNNIHVIRPFMREGRFFTKLLLAAAENRGIELSIEPLYISRLAAYTSHLGELTVKELSTLMAGANVKLQDVVRNLQIEDCADNFRQYMNTPLTELQMMFDADGKSIYDKIYDYLSSAEILNIVRKRNRDKKHIFIEYLQQMRLTEPSITLDIGWNGTTMNAVYRAIKEITPDAELLQLLFCSSKNVAQNSVDGCIIKGFVGNYGGLQGKFKRIFIPIFELFCSCAEGPTVGYKYQGQKIVPVTEKNVFSEEWLDHITDVQCGVMAFQDEYFKICRRKGMNINVKAQGVQALSMIERLFSYPLLQEVLQLGSAELDQNIGIENRIIPVVEPDLISKYQKLGMERFYMLFRNRQRSVTWYQAFQTLDNPLFYIQMHNLQNAHYEKSALILLTRYVAKAAGEGKFVLVYCGSDTDQIMVYLRAMEVMNKISGIVSVDDNLQDVVYDGIPISSIRKIFDTKLYFIPAKEPKIYYAVRDIIVNMLGPQAKIIGYFEEDERIWNDER